MIPWAVAHEIRGTLLDYLRSTWGLTDAAFERALFDFLGGPQGLFQGSFLRLGLPFAPAAPRAAPSPPHLYLPAGFRAVNGAALDGAGPRP